jgi:type II secretory pathway pseudopilin PulG
MVMDMKGRQKEFENEAGYVLLAVIFLTVILLISLAIAAPKMARSIQRDKELETIHRGEQYKRAIKLYYQKFGSYPTSIDQLVQTNQMRFLRKKYTDPLTGAVWAGARAAAGILWAATDGGGRGGRGGIDVRGGSDDDHGCEWGSDCERRSIGNRHIGRRLRRNGDRSGIDESESGFAKRDFIDVRADIDDSGYGFVDGFAEWNEWDGDVGDDIWRRRADCGLHAAGEQALAGRLQAADAL